jgi:hypothetical protein
MARFTKEQMLDELRTIFLFEADHLLLEAGEKIAAAFIGFSPDETGEYCHRPASDVDLGRFQIAASFDAGYEYAFRPSVLSTLAESEVQDLTVFMLGTPKAGGIMSGGETHDFMTSNGLCQTVADTVYARWKLEWDTAGTNDFTARELALLADMTEGAVRNALADKSENGLRAIPGTKNPVMVDHAEALRWLRGRRGFVPSPERPRDDRFLTESLRNIHSAEALGHLISQRLWGAFGSPSETPSALDWSTEEIDNWQKGAQSFNEEKARQLARALDFDEPLFVGKVLEVTLRRDLFTNIGGK